MSRRAVTTAARQRGWIGLFVLLLALAIVGLLLRSVLKQYGVLPGDGEPAAAAPASTATEWTPSGTTAVDRAREVESLMRDQLPRLDVEQERANGLR